MLYTRVCKTLHDKGKLVLKGSHLDHIDDEMVDHYRSIYDYNQEQFEQFRETRTIAGITDVTSSYLVFDFDSANLDESREDTIELVSRLLTHEIAADQFTICYSGSKGFSVEIETTSTFTVEQYKNLTAALAGDLKSRDAKITNPSRVFRIPGTKHQKSGLFKKPLSLTELSDLTTEEIKKLAEQSDSSNWHTEQVVLPESLLKLSRVVTKPNKKYDSDILPDLDLSAKPKNMPACKFAILNGMFKSGNRNHSLMALGAHFKAQGFPKEVTYHMLKGAAELQARRTETDPYSKDEIWNNIINVIYSSTWKGATYSCKDHEFLQDVCPVRNTTKCGMHKKESIVEVTDISNSFIDFATNLEKNIIKTGLKELDEKIMITTSMSVGLLGSPGSGKTSVAMKILANVKNSGANGLFCSLDMGAPIVFMKMAANVSGLDPRQIIQIYKTDKVKRQEITKLIEEKYGSLPMTFKTGQSVDDIRQMILSEQEKRGEKIKLVVIDYLECLLGPYSDATANSALFSGQLKDLSTDLETCVITLVQPQKSAGDPSQPLLSMRKIKGASALEQNFRTILSVYREGFNPRRPEDDKFMTVSCLKNTLGGLFSIDYGWQGLKGELTPLDDFGKVELEDLRSRLAEEKTSSEDSGW